MMKKVVLVVMLALCFLSVNMTAWGAALLHRDVIYQGPGKPQDPKDPPK